LIGSTIRARLRPEEAMTLVFFAVLFMALAAMSASNAVLEGPAASYPGSAVRLLILTASLAAFLALIRFRPRWELARDSMPFVFCANVYASLHDLIRFFRAPDITATLAHWDHALFGVQPTVWAERFITPAATDFFTVCYWLFYVCAPLLGLFLWLNGDRRAFRHTMVTVVLCLYIGYVGYVAFPASAPRLWMPEAYEIPLQGNTILDFTRSATAAVPLTAKGAFPSLHCAVAVLALLLAWRHLRWFFWVQLPFAVGLILGTVYLRHHWVVDILSGFLVTAIAFVAGPRIEDRWFRASKRAGDDAGAGGAEESREAPLERQAAGQ
jgi:membrane-associated phospholipid phosphatase